MSLLSNTIAADLESGIYEARLASYKEVDDGTHKPYIALLIEANGQEIEDRLYESRISYFMRSIRPQFDLQFTACTLQDILDAATKQDFFIEITYDPTYGRVVSYGVK